MKLLIYTPVFYPSTGGIETFNSLLAQGLASNGFEIVVITPISDSCDDSQFNFKVVRGADFKVFWRYYKWCDVYLQSVLSLKGIWPLMLKRKKWIVVHHTCSFYSWDQSPTAISYLKHIVTMFAKNIAVSNAVGINLKLSNYKVIWNAYNNKVFKCLNWNKRKDFIFVGRLVTEKGGNLLIDAYNDYLKLSKYQWKLTIIGDGPEKEDLARLVSKYGITDFVSFKGKRTGNDLVHELNIHHTLIVPSLCKEAFGIIALEGIACGCFCLVSDSDGLQEAAGARAILFKKGSVKDLVKKMLYAETNDYIPMEHLNEIIAHLSKYTPECMIRQYITYIQSEMDSMLQ